MHWLVSELVEKKSCFVTSEGPIVQPPESSPLSLNPLQNKIPRETGKKEEWKSHAINGKHFIPEGDERHF
jgi:hypothetical protein